MDKVSVFCETWDLILKHLPTREECPTRVCDESVPQECPTRAWSVPHECVRVTRVSHKSGLQECPARLYYIELLVTRGACHHRILFKGVFEGCQARASNNIWPFVLAYGCIWPCGVLSGFLLVARLRSQQDTVPASLTACISKLWSQILDLQKATQPVLGILNHSRKKP